MARFDQQRRSKNIENRRGGQAVGAGVIIMLLRFIFSRFGIVGVVAVVGGYVALSAIGFDPLKLLAGGGAASTSSAAGEASPYDDMVAAVLGSTEEVWAEIFREQRLAGGVYPPTSLILYSGSINTDACGFAQSAVGPFYCPLDKQIYIDTAFFDELGSRFQSPGDFPPAYVIAHEVGHHVQTVLGIAAQVRETQERTNEVGRNQLQVRMELQADCYAGLWAHHFRQGLEPGDIEEALRAAEAIGDDTLQQQSGRGVNPDSFTHGSAAQRQRWFSIGYQSGDFNGCDTFAVPENRL